MQTSSDPLASHNERVKLFANFLNAVALGLIGFAVLRPLAEAGLVSPRGALWWGGVGLALHGLAHYVLGSLRKEMKS